MVERFARVCPTHRQVLEEMPHGLRCPLFFHQVSAWLVLDVDTGEVLGAGRIAPRRGEGPPAAAWLGPRLRHAPDMLLDLESLRGAADAP